MHKVTHLKIGVCSIYPQEHTFQYEGDEKQNLQPKFVEVILYLAKHYPRIISREELIDTIWNGNYYVGEKSLTNAIWQLRKTLTRASDEAEAIETIRKTGYRLLIEPSTIDYESASNKSETQKSVNLKPWMLLLPLLLLIGLTGSWIWQSNETQLLLQPTITAVTTEPGRELYVSLSPDKRYIAYRWLTREREHNLYLRDLNQLEQPARQLTFDSASEGHSVWSNDGQSLYFSRRNYQDDFCHIVKLNIATRQEFKVTECPIDNSYRYLDISPDDRYLAYRGQHDKNFDSGIYLIDLIKENPEPIRFSCTENCGYRDRDMAFSPDGKSMLVSRRQSALIENLYLVDLKTKRSEQLTIGEENIVGFSWHPDGRRVVYASEHADVYNGYLLDTLSKKILPLNIDGMSFPTFTKEEFPSLYYVQREEKNYISAFRLNEAIPSSPFPILLSEYNHSMPDYSRVAKKIAYISNESGQYELWTADPTGYARERLTTLETIARYPKWSHDGTRIVFLSKTEDDLGDKLYIVNVASKEIHVLSTRFSDHNHPSWSFDDSSIISSVSDKGVTNLFMFNIESQKSHQLTNNGGRYGVMVSATKLLYTGYGSASLQQLDLNYERGHPLRHSILINDAKEFPRYSWTHSRDGIYFRKNIKNHQQIAFYDFTTQQVTPLLKLPGRISESFGALTIEEESEQIIFTQRDERQGSIKRLEHPLFH